MGLSLTGGGVNILAKSAQSTTRQADPTNGGLRVLGSNDGSGNLELSLGETINLNFSRTVDIVSLTLNGLWGTNGDTEAADGVFAVSGDGSIPGNADNYVGVGSDGIPNVVPSPYGSHSNFCGITDFWFTPSALRQVVNFGISRRCQPDGIGSSLETRRHRFHPLLLTPLPVGHIRFKRSFQSFAVSS